jgi:CRP/FNR family transcriptional regulator, anaerobic regulatory protein
MVFVRRELLRTFISKSSFYLLSSPILISYLKTLIPVSPHLETEIARIGKQVEVARGQVLLKTDERCNYIYFVEKGLLRGYYFEEAKEVTSWFAPEGEFATCFYGFIARRPSYEFIQSLEDSELIQIAYSDLQDIYLKFPETERVGRIVTENYYIKLEERLLNIQFKTAKERYQKFMSAQASLLQRASLGQIASYLGITQETLSRIRAEI